MALNTDNYQIVRQFIDTERAISLGDEFKAYVELYGIGGDEQVKKCRSMYDHVPFLEILTEKVNHISEICGERVLPTFTYSRVYYNGSDLKRHTDRDTCEVSATLNLGYDTPWPIYIVDKHGEEVCVDLKPGDAMVYYGSMSAHWRETFDGEYCNQVFLHYVKSRGQFAEHYFDKLQ